MPALRISAVVSCSLEHSDLVWACKLAPKSHCDMIFQGSQAWQQCSRWAEPSSTALFTRYVYMFLGILPHVSVSDFVRRTRGARLERSSRGSGTRATLLGASILLATRCFSTTFGKCHQRRHHVVSLPTYPQGWLQLSDYPAGLSRSVVQLALCHVLHLSDCLKWTR